MMDRLSDKRILEIERRVKWLEKELSKASYCYFLSKKKSEEKATNHQFDYTFTVNSFTYLKLEVKAVASLSTFDLLIKINDANACDYKSVTENSKIECVLPFAEGVNKVSIIISGSNAFEVSECTLETQGNISYLEEDYLLQVINEANRSVILSLFGEKLSLSEYTATKTQEKFALKPVKGASLCTFNNKYLLAIIDGENNGKLILLDEKLQKVSEKVFEGNIISLCIIASKNPRVFAVKGNKVFEYTVQNNLEFIKTFSGLRGKKLKSSPAVSNYIIVIDYNGDAKLVEV